MNSRTKNKPETLLKFIISLTTVLVTALILHLSAYAVELTATPNSPNTDTQMRLTWTPAPGAQCYKVYRGTDPATQILVDTVTVNQQVYLSCVDGDQLGSELLPKTPYNYEIKAYSNIDGTGELVAERDTVGNTTSQMIKPTITYYEFDIATRNVKLQWDINSKAAMGSVIRRVGEVVPAIPKIDTKAVEATFPFGPGNNSIDYEIVSMDAALDPDPDNGRISDSSDSVRIVPVTAPLLKATMSNGIATIIWNDFTMVSRFRLERSSWILGNNGYTWSSWEVVNQNPSGSSATNTPAMPGMYRYQLIAKPESNYAGFVISNSVVKPAAPQNLTAVFDTPTLVHLSWDISNSNYSKLQIERRTGSGAYSVIADNLRNDDDEYDDMYTFAPNTTYTYRVTSYDPDSANNAAVSSEVSISTSVPAAPTGLGITVNSGGTSHTLTWTDNSSSETQFVIERRENNSDFATVNPGNPAAPVGPNATTCTFSNVVATKSYVYRVAAWNPFGMSNYTNEVSIGASSTVNTPSALIAKAVSPSQIDLSWTYAGNGSYTTIVERKTGSAGNWSVITVTPAGTYKYSDSGLSANTQYFYRVRCQLGNGLVSDTEPTGNNGRDATTFLGTLSLSGSPSSGSTIYLSWSGTTAGSDIIIERKMSNGNFAVLMTVNSTVTGWYDTTGLVSGAVYTYRIKAKSATNESIYSNEAIVSNVYLNAPSGLSASVNQEGGITLTWTDNSPDESGFEIWRMVYGAGSYSKYATVDRNTTSYTDSVVTSGVQYFYMVRAFVSDTGIFSGYTNTVSAGTGIVGPPADLNYSYVSNSQIQLTWVDTASNESGYKVEWKVGADGAWSVLAWLSANTTSYNAYGLNQYLTYYFRIRAYSYSGNLDSLSKELLVSTALPNPPAGVTAKAISSTQVNLKWTDNSDNEAGFRILRKASWQNYYTTIGETAAGATEYSDKTLYPETAYKYKVVAFSAGGTAESVEASATTGKRVTFPDISGVSWARDAVENLAGRGVIAGKDGKNFKPNDTVTRAEFVSMMVRAFKLDTTPVGGFADVKIGKWYYREIMIASYYGIISPDASNRFYPDKPITREEIAVIIFKTLEAVGKPLDGYSNSVLEKFRDKDQISLHALSCVASVVGEGIMSGVSENSLAPGSSATRAMAAALIYKVIDR